MVPLILISSTKRYKLLVGVFYDITVTSLTINRQFYDKFHKRQVIRVSRLTWYSKIVNWESLHSALCDSTPMNLRLSSYVYYPSKNHNHRSNIFAIFRSGVRSFSAETAKRNALKKSSLIQEIKLHARFLPTFVSSIWFPPSISLANIEPEQIALAFDVIFLITFFLF